MTFEYVQNDIKIYNCDNKTILKEIIKNLENQNKKFIFVSDPPFNINYKYSTYKDNLEEKFYFENLINIFKNYPHVIIHYHEMLHKYSYFSKNFPQKIVSWVYNSNTPKQHRGIAFYNITPNFSKMGQDYKNPNDKRIKERIKKGFKARLYDWWEIQQFKNVNKLNLKHPCIMPLEVMKRIIGILPEDTIIIDPFMGSGSTGLACQDLSRKFIGIEIDEDYYKLAKLRLETNSRTIY